MKLTNPPCKQARKCQPFCGMCHGNKRIINDQSLFGECRKAGQCICTNWSTTNNCYWINGSKNGGQDCTKAEHPKHHKIIVNDRDVREAMGAIKSLGLNDRILAAAQPRLVFNFKNLRTKDGGYSSWR